MLQQNSSISSFRKFLFRILFPLIGGLVIGGYLFTMLFEKKVILNSQISGAYKINRIIKATDPDEVPIFGSSRALCSFIPDKMGGKFFNYGLSNAQDDVILFFLKEECKKQKNDPRIIINFDLDGLSKSIGDISYYLYNCDYEPVKNLMGNEFKSHYKIPFVKYYGYYEEYFKYMLNDRMQLTKYTNKGASSEKHVLTPKKFNEMVEMRKKNEVRFQNNPELLNDLKHVIADNQNRQFIFVISPYHNSYFFNYSNEPDMKLFLSYLDDLPNAEVLDFSHHYYADSMLNNTSHVNYLGALAFSLQLKDSLDMMKTAIPTATLGKNNGKVF